MTTTEPFAVPPVPRVPPPPPSSIRRQLRRSQTDRVAAGVAGGLGEYFGVDPVLFRVLFATAAFFGGAGLLGYLLAWAAIPEQGTHKAPIDGWMRGLRERRLPFVLVAIVGVVLFWLVAFSWWAPGRSFPIFVFVIVAVLIFGRPGHRRRRPDGSADDAPTSPVTSAGSVNLEKTETDETTTLPAQEVRSAPQWVHDMRQWASESREASRNRRRRAMPLRIGALAVLAVTLTVLGLIDAASGISIPTYFWFTGAIVGATLLTGMVLRRTPWSLTSLLVISAIGLIGFGGTHASLHDGIGQKEWSPTTSTAKAHYRLAFGQGILDLRSLPMPTSAETIDVTMASGQVKVIAPASLNVSVRAEVHFGNLTVDGNDYDDVDGFRSRGVNLDRTVPAPGGSVGAPVLVRVHLADGNVSVDHR